MNIWTRRAYDPPTRNDGYRVLVDRLWPRGVAKDKARIDDWLKEIAPSDSLRKWFGHDPGKWNDFKDRYFKELDRREAEVQKLLDIGQKRRLTLVFGAKDEERNNATALKEYLERRAKRDG